MKKRIIFKIMLLSSLWLIGVNSLKAEVQLAEGVTLSGSGEVDFFGRKSNGMNGKALNDATGVANMINSGAFNDPANAEYKNQVLDQYGKSSGFNEGVEVDSYINFNGRHNYTALGGGSIIWKTSSKVATDFRYDSFGMREAWGGLDTKYGKLIFGHQLGNIWYAMDSYWGGSAGMGFLSADYGVSQQDFGNAIQYVSPVFAGFTIKVLADVGSRVAYSNVSSSNIANSQLPADAFPVSNSEAYEFYGNYENTFDNVKLRVDLGYYHAVNDNNLSGFTGKFDSKGTNPDNLLHNNADTFMVGTSVNVSNFKVALSYKYDAMQGETLWGTIDEGKTFSFQTISLMFGYEMNFGKVDLGYNMIIVPNDVASYSTDLIGTAGNVSSVNAQYTHYLNEKKTFTSFVQFRYAMYEEETDMFFVTDGKNFNEKSSARLLVGLWYGF
jgi:hypothetical protein